MKLILIGLLLYGGGCFAQLTGEEIFRRSADSIKNLSSIKYSIYSELGKSTFTAEIMQTRSKDSFPIFEVAQIKVAGIEMNNGESSQISWASDGKAFEFLDNKKGSIIRIEQPDDKKIIRGIFSTILLPINAYFQKEPFHVLFDEKRGFKYINDTTVFNVPCHVIHVTGVLNHEVAGTVYLSSYWYIGKSDFLVYGYSSGVAKNFVRIKERNKRYTDKDFQLAEHLPIETRTGQEPESEGLLATGVSAPDWTLPSSLRDNITLSKLKGKVVLLDFWGTWCVPCLKAMPDIQAIHEHFKNKAVEVIGVSVETEKTADPLGYVKKKGYTYPIVIDGKLIAEKYKVSYFPSIYIIDKTGKIIHREHSSNQSDFKEQLIAKIEAALKF